LGLDESDVEDPANPAPPAACPQCGRRRLVQTIVVVGVDVTAI
jgi:DNA-directed RNA polymerase subunit RPC12/RpoP